MPSTADAPLFNVPMNSQWIARHDEKLRGWGRDVLEERNTVVQTGHLSLTRARCQFIPVPFLATLDTHSGHRGLGVASSPRVESFGRRRREEKQPVYLRKRKYKVQSHSCPISSKAGSSGLGHTLGSLSEHVL